MNFNLETKTQNSESLRNYPYKKKKKKWKGRKEKRRSEKKHGRLKRILDRRRRRSFSRGDAREGKKTSRGMKTEKKRVERKDRERGRVERRRSRGGCWQRRLLIARSNPASTATPPATPSSGHPLLSPFRSFCSARKPQSCCTNPVE